MTLDQVHAAIGNDIAGMTKYFRVPMRFAVVAYCPDNEEMSILVTNSPGAEGEILRVGKRMVDAQENAKDMTGDEAVRRLTFNWNEAPPAWPTSIAPIKKGRKPA